jgi:hypothetical protein
MEYALMVYQGTTPLPVDPEAWATLSEDEQQAIYRDYANINKTEHVKPGLPLGLPEDAVTVQVRDGETVTRKGTYLAEGVGGFLVFKTDDLDEAIKLASRIPAARYGGAVEIRPVKTYW